MLRRGVCGSAAGGHATGLSETAPGRPDDRDAGDSLTISAPTLPALIDHGDGVVNALDIDQLYAHLGDPGRVNLLDLDIVGSNYGFERAGGGASSWALDSQAGGGLTEYDNWARPNRE